MSNKSVVGYMIRGEEKKHSVIYASIPNSEPEFKTYYVPREILDQLGHPDTIKITLEVA